MEADIWGMGRFSMEKGEDDWWSCDVQGIEKGFHYYGLRVNGVDVVDGNAPVGYGGLKELLRAAGYKEHPKPLAKFLRLQQNAAVIVLLIPFPEGGECHPSMSAFLEELPGSCVPFIDRTYRTLADRAAP